MAHSFSFSTTQMPGTQSIDAWRQAMAEVYYRLDIKSEHSERLNGQLIDWQSDVMGISNFKADAQRVTRRKAAAKADKAEDFVFLFPTRKPMRFEQRGREDMVLPGNVFLLNSAEPYVVDVPDGSENITIKIKRENLLGRAPMLDDLCGRANFANPYLIPAVAMLGEQMLRLKPDDNASAPSFRPSSENSISHRRLRLPNIGSQYATCTRSSTPTDCRSDNTCSMRGCSARIG
jgi:hypothetical protein